MTTQSLNPPRLPIDWRGGLALTFAALFGLMATTWPLFVAPGAVLSDTTIGPWMFAMLLPLLTAVVLAQISSGGLDARLVAMLGVLSAVIAAVRPFGAGAAGVETVFFLIILAGRVYGPAFGFVLGNTALFASALLTGGVGPWLPYQMLAASFIGLGAGLLPGRQPRTRWGHRAEVLMLAAYGCVAAIVFGLLLNMSFWPFAITTGALAYEPGADFAENFRRLIAFSLATSAGWEIGRAVTTAVLIVLTGPLLLRVLRRSARKARWV
nr:ECF transporter S component [Natronoglycomyces albus]